MKILRLSFKNLNSLAGVWEVDFKHPDYVSSGIFAITGPTGAGKTTILDAICLALYGQTPRLGRITQGENEIMSRQTGECFAEVEFETAKGRFRCHWSQHRSRKQADGQLQSPRHEIAAAKSGMILESKLRTVADKVEDVTGMDFDRFTRSTLLAQGGFAAFLQARPDERAPILEQITGTAIYSRISIKVHERTSEERKLLGELRADLDGIQLLSPEEAEAQLAEKGHLQLAESELVSEARILGEAQSWWERIGALENELRQLEEAKLTFEIRKAAAAPELEQLAAAGRALQLGGEHSHLLALRAQQDVEQGELAVAAARLPELQLCWQTAFEALELSESQLALARVEQEQEAELIRITRALDLKLGEANSRLQKMVEEIEKAGQQNGAYSRAITACDQRMNGIDAELQTVAVFLGEHQADAALIEALTGIEQQLKALKSLNKQYCDTIGKLERHAALIESTALATSRSESVWQESQHAVADAEQRLASVRAACETLLQGRDLSLWRDDAEAFAARLSRLDLAQEALTRIGEVRLQLTALLLRAEELEQKRLLLVQRELVLTGESELREQVARQLQDNVVLLNRVRNLEDERRQLVDGVPCPLCGSVEHPYAAGNIPQLDDVQKELEQAVAAAKMVREELATTKLELGAVTKDLQLAHREQAELQGRQARDEVFCGDAFAELGLNDEPGASVNGRTGLESIRFTSDECREKMARQREVIQGAEQYEQEERRTQAALATLKDKLAEYDKTRLTARLGHESAVAERTRLERESVTLHEDRERVLAEVGRAVAAYGFREVVPDKADELLSVLTVRRNDYIQRLQTGEQLEKARADVAAERETQRALLVEAEKALVDKEQQLRDGISQRDAVIEQRLEQYGERNPDVEEKRLADAVRQAGDRRDMALQDQHRLHAERDGLNQQVERLTHAITQREVQLSGMETGFSMRLIEAGFADETAFVQACLPQERFDALMQKVDRLRADEAALQARYQDRAEAMAGELDKHLTVKPLELIREENAAVNERLSLLQQSLGALAQRLQQYAEQQQRHQSRLQAIERQQKECDRWERLHSLIGSGDGKKFRNFAQGLTFELMVAHANRQLQKMSDRYILVRDAAEPLELNVIDNYQAGEIRSTKNLSGGESFIASLALSLGLSSMASRNVRVDSLFLDEGFGTLDEDALETALETLSGLQQDGKLIGIISHVPALKERIGTQIQVEAGSAGRSRLSGPGCRRINEK
ncbi:MAG: AAA family ATPase [Desulfuromonadaceae bacterium]|nr:AAA family ATPase [Desulfuromonadaceae bacterium]